MPFFKLPTITTTKKLNRPQTKPSSSPYQGQSLCNLGLEPYLCSDTRWHARVRSPSPELETDQHSLRVTTAPRHSTQAQYLLDSYHEPTVASIRVLPSSAIPPRLRTHVTVSRKSVPRTVCNFSQPLRTDKSTALHTSASLARQLRAMAAPKSKSSMQHSKPSINVVANDEDDISAPRTEPIQRPSLSRGTFGGDVDHSLDTNSDTSKLSASNASTDVTSPSGAPETSALTPRSPYTPTAQKSPAATTPPDAFSSVMDDGTIMIGYRPSGSDRHGSEEPIVPEQPANGSPTFNRGPSPDLLAQVMELAIHARTDRSSATHGVVKGPRQPKSQHDHLTALPAYNADKPLPPVLQPSQQRTTRSGSPVTRTVLVSPPVYNPRERPSFQWVSEQRQTSRPVDAWAMTKRWMCCECSGHTIVEQQICSKLCCQHARCQLNCKSMKYT